MSSQGGRTSPTHSIVMAAHDAEGTLRLCARSVLEQTVPDLELIIVDDGSRDSTAAIAAELAADERVVVHHQEQGGPSAARNKGLELARGEFVTFLDSDDFILRSWLGAMEAALRARPDAVLAYADAWVLDRNRDQIRTDSLGHEGWHFVPTDDPPRDPLACAALLAEGNFISGVRMAKREAAVAAGGFDTALRYAEDYDLWLRMVIAGGGLVRVGERLAVISDTPGSLSKNALAMERSVAEVCERLIADPQTAPEVRTGAERQLAAVEQRIPRYASRVREPLRLVRNRLGRTADSLRADRHWHREVPAQLLAELPLLSEL